MKYARKNIKGDFCVYCGEMANSIEHFPPRSFSHRGVTMPACKECNSFAGTEYPCDFQKRALVVKTKIEKKYKNLLKIPTWTNDDLSFMRGNLKRSVNLWQEKRRKFLARIAWNAEEYLSLIDRNKNFALILADLKNTTMNDE